MDKFKLYGVDQLPEGFAYPERLRRMSESGEYPTLSPWWFVDADSKAGKLFYSIREHDGRNLVPFAKVDDGRGDIACFDGDDVSGNPPVLMLVLDESGRAYSFKDFDDWMNAALTDSARQ
jgi:hypothetical protein